MSEIHNMDENYAKMIDGFENLDKKFPNTEAFIIDSHDDDGLGGTGKTFDWSKNKFETKKPIIIAGGLNCDNVFGMTIENFNKHYGEQVVVEETKEAS